MRWSDVEMTDYLMWGLDEGFLWDVLKILHELWMVTWLLDVLNLQRYFIQIFCVLKVELNILLI